MPMRRSQFHRVEAGFRQIPDESWKVPVLRDVVRDGAELQTAEIGGRPGVLTRLKGGKCRDASHAREKIASMDRGSLPRLTESRHPYRMSADEIQTLRLARRRGAPRLERSRAGDHPVHV